MQDATKVLLGTTQSNFRTIDNRKGEIDAGKAVRLKSDDTISIAEADGHLLGISAGKDLSNIARTAVVRRGKAVPILLTDSFNPTVGAQVSISDTTGLAIAAGAGATAVNAIYVTSTLTGIKEDGTEANVALIDFPGGL